MRKKKDIILATIFFKLNKPNFFYNSTARIGSWRVILRFMVPARSLFPVASVRHYVETLIK